MGAKPSKNRSTGGEPLNKATIDELCHDTGFSEQELLDWHRNFYKDCPDGRLTLRQFEQTYAKIMGKPTQKTADYIRHMFNVYDHDKNQYIDFREFVMALSAASVVNRLRLVETLFHVFDLDNDGKITKDEIGKMLHTLVDVTNSNDKQHRRHHANSQEQNKQINLQNRIDDAFNELNANDDDHITKDEFIDWYMKSGLISDVQANEIGVQDPSQIQQIEKKSRKLLEKTSHNKSHRDGDDARYGVAHLVRHMSRMTERKSQIVEEEDDDDDNDDNVRNHPTTVSSSHYHNHQDINDERRSTRPSIRQAIVTESIESPMSKENERWQHLFNSVLGNIRAQRTNDQQENGENHFSSWKHEGEEHLKSEYLRQRNSEQQENRAYLSTKMDTMYTSTRPPPSPEVVTTRL